MFVSLRDSRFLFSLSTTKEEEKKWEANCQGCESGVVVNLNQLKVERERERERKKEVN